MKYLLINGSPRIGNTKYLIDRLNEDLGKSHSKIELSQIRVNNCTGCGGCEHGDCHIIDDMSHCMDKLLDSEIVLLATPNYFDNVSGLVKSFMDRTNPFTYGDNLKGKKIFTIVVGGRAKKHSLVVAEAVQRFAIAQSMEYAGSICLEADSADDLKNSIGDEGYRKLLEKIVGLAE